MDVITTHRNGDVDDVGLDGRLNGEAKNAKDERKLITRIANP
jgi:hypothetical protein